MRRGKRFVDLRPRPIYLFPMTHHVECVALLVAPIDSGTTSRNA